MRYFYVISRLQPIWKSSHPGGWSLQATEQLKDAWFELHFIKHTTSIVLTIIHIKTVLVNKTEISTNSTFFNPIFTLLRMLWHLMSNDCTVCTPWDNLFLPQSLKIQLQSNYCQSIFSNKRNLLSVLISSVCGAMPFTHIIVSSHILRSITEQDKRMVYHSRP